MQPKFVVSRRRDLQSAGALLAAGAGAFRPRSAGAAEVSEVMTTLSTYMSGAATAASRSGRREDKHMILDTLAAMISGSELPPGRFAIQFARALWRRAGRDRRRIERSAAGRSKRRSPTGSSRIPTRPTIPIRHRSRIPAALPFPPRLRPARSSASTARGFSARSRLATTSGPASPPRSADCSTWSTAIEVRMRIAGTFGAAAAAGCAAGLNAQQMRWLLSYTAQQASGLASWQRDTDHIEKAFDFGGMPARNGVTSALLVQAGGTGVDDVFSGADNFFQAFVPRNDPTMVVEKLGERYEIMRTNIKKWTVGSPIQAPLDALDTLLKRHRFQPVAGQTGDRPASPRMKRRSSTTGRSPTSRCSTARRNADRRHGDVQIGA